jgi:hypothetical protein
MHLHFHRVRIFWIPPKDAETGVAGDDAEARGIAARVRCVPEIAKERIISSPFLAPFGLRGGRLPAGSATGWLNPRERIWSVAPKSIRGKA